MLDKATELAEISKNASAITVVNESSKKKSRSSGNSNINLSSLWGTEVKKNSDGDCAAHNSHRRSNAKNRETLSIKRKGTDGVKMEALEIPKRKLDYT